MSKFKQRTNHLSSGDPLKALVPISVKTSQPVVRSVLGSSSSKEKLFKDCAVGAEDKVRTMAVMIMIFVYLRVDHVEDRLDEVALCLV